MTSSSNKQPLTESQKNLPRTVHLVTNTPSGHSKRSLAIILVLGLASAALYLLLFLFSDTLVEWSAATRAGDNLYALVPLAIALVFSFVHGTFTARFWDLLGLKAKK